MLTAKKKWIAAIIHILGPLLTFLPGLALWFWAWDGDLWLKAHGHSAARFQLTVLAGYVFIAMAFSSSEENLQVHSVISQLQVDVHQHLLLPLIWLMAGHLGFAAIWSASIFFSLRNAWRAIHGIHASLLLMDWCR